MNFLPKALSPLLQAIALAKLIEGGDRVSRKDDFTATLAGFYLLKYGTDAPRLVRQDSDIKHMRHHTTARVYRKIAEVEKEEEKKKEGKQNL